MKSNKKILLSIGIPTWNRSIELSNCLESIIVQLLSNSELIDLVEIIIANNASTDTTRVDTKKLISKHSQINISYIEHNFNKGFDKNLDSIFKKSKGEFVWIMGDDDALIEGSLIKVTNQINKNNPDLGILFANYKSFDSDLLNEIFYEDLFFRKLNNSKLFSNYVDMYKFTNMLGFSLISTNIISKKLWNIYVEKSIEKSLIIHSYVQFEIFTRNYNIYIFKEPLVKYRTNNNKGRYIKDVNDDPFKLNYSAFLLLKKYKSRLKRSIWNNEMKREVFRIINGILYFKLNRIYFSKKLVFKNILKNIGLNPISFLIITTLVLPHRFLVILKSLKNTFK